MASKKKIPGSIVRLEHDIPQCENIVLAISAGQPYHEPEYFERLLNAAIIYAERYDAKIHVMIYDEVQGHTQQVKGWARKDNKRTTGALIGQAWLAEIEQKLLKERGLKTWQGYAPQIAGVMRFGEIVQDPEYKVNLRKLITRFRKRGPFFDGICENARDFCRRMEENDPAIKGGRSYDRKAAMRSSRRFQLEEFAAEAVITNRLNPVILYPGAENHAMEHVTDIISKRRLIRAYVTKPGEVLSLTETQKRQRRAAVVAGTVQDIGPEFMAESYRLGEDAIKPIEESRSVGNDSNDDVGSSTGPDRPGRYSDNGEPTAFGPPPILG